jgi:hypothetical protein
MKYKRILLVIGAISLLSACGGGGGSSSNTAIQAAIDSFLDFGTVVDSTEIKQCIDLAQATPCPCPGGSGTATWNAATLTVTLANCKSAAGMTYNGTIKADSIDPTELTADMTVFGECTNASGTVSTNGCGGNISGTCDGGNVDCNVIDDTATAGACTLSC